MSHSQKTEFDNLKEKYIKTFPERLESLQNHIHSLQKTMQEDTLISLRMEIHKLAGTAGTFGFPKVSEICKEFENVLIEKIKSYPNVEKKSEWIALFETYLKKIKESSKT